MFNRYGLSWNPDGIVATCGYDGKILVYDLESKETKHSNESNSFEDVNPKSSYSNGVNSQDSVVPIEVLIGLLMYFL